MQSESSPSQVPECENTKVNVPFVKILPDLCKDVLKKKKTSPTRVPETWPEKNLSPAILLAS